MATPGEWIYLKWTLGKRRENLGLISVKAFLKHFTNYWQASGGWDGSLSSDIKNDLIYEKNPACNSKKNKG